MSSENSISNSFLEKLVDYIQSKYSGELSKLCIVLPNRRAGLFLKKYLARKITKPIWLPKIYSIEDFISHLAEVTVIDNISLYFKFYEAYKEIKKDEAESFDDFIRWAPTMLNDFNEIDQYLVDGKILYQNLKNFKAIDGWSLGNDELTEFQQKYLKFWESMGEYYAATNTLLLKERKAYSGLAYKIVSENIGKNNKVKEWNNIIFAGFNALNAAEEQIIKSLEQQGKAEVLWDADKYYVQNPKQEAGYFLRNYKRDDLLKSSDKKFIWEENNLLETAKKIDIIGIPKNVSQTKFAGEIVEKNKWNDEKSALVLADEKLLFPLLHAIPESVENINITMGFPLSAAPIASFVDILFNLHLNKNRFGKGKFYHKDVLKFLNHPYASIILENTSRKNNRQIAQTIEKRNYVFLSQKDIQYFIEESEKANAAPQLEFTENNNESFLSIFKNWENALDVITCLSNLIQMLRKPIAQKQASERKNNLELEFIFSFSKIIKRLEANEAGLKDLKEISTIQSIINQLFRSTTIPFYGEPLKGLQIMGMLETRTLDFENIILLSTNEDVLPTAKSQNTFIPFEVKVAYKLPTYRDRDSVFAYHFYRLLQRAKNIYFLYNTETDLLGSGEKSRFITQVVNELAKENKNITITESIAGFDIESIKENKIEIKKTDAVTEKIKAKGKKGFSPSALNSYKNCSLQFYFQSILGLKENEEVEEQIGADTLGTVMHSVLEELYKPFINQNITALDLKKMVADIPKLTEKSFSEEYSKTEMSYGKNLITLKVAIKYLKNYIEREAKNIESLEKQKQQLFIKALEKQLSAEIETSFGKIKISGIADRIDDYGGITRIVDYKTGKVETKELSVKDLSEINFNIDLNKSFQLLMYALMYGKQTGNAFNTIQSGIITFRGIGAGLKAVKVNGEENISQVMLIDFEKEVRLLLEEIYNNKIDFKQTEDIERCKYCNFKQICNR